MFFSSALYYFKYSSALLQNIAASHLFGSLLYSLPLTTEIFVLSFGLGTGRTHHDGACYTSSKNLSTSDFGQDPSRPGYALIQAACLFVLRVWGYGQAGERLPSRLLLPWTHRDVGCSPFLFQKCGVNRLSSRLTHFCGAITRWPTFLLTSSHRDQNWLLTLLHECGVDLRPECTGCCCFATPVSKSLVLDVLQKCLASSISCRDLRLQASVCDLAAVSTVDLYTPL